MILREYSLSALLVLGSLLCSGCSQDNPGTWPRDRVSAKVMESLQMTEVTLSPDPAGGFSGTGKRADGETLTLTVTQDAATHRISWDAKGDRGFVEDGYFELK